LMRIGIYNGQGFGICWFEIQIRQSTIWWVASGWPISLFCYICYKLLQF